MSLYTERKRGRSEQRNKHVGAGQSSHSANVCQNATENKERNTFCLLGTTSFTSERATKRAHVAPVHSVRTVVVCQTQPTQRTKQILYVVLMTFRLRTTTCVDEPRHRPLPRVSQWCFTGKTRPPSSFSFSRAPSPRAPECSFVGNHDPLRFTVPFFPVVQGAAIVASFRTGSIPAAHAWVFQHMARRKKRR